MSRRSLAVVSAGLGEPSSTSLLATRLAAATEHALRAHHLVVDVDVIELRHLAHDLADNLLTSFASDRLQHAKDVVAAADGVIAVSPIFSASYNGLFKDFFDLLDPETLDGMPVLIGATAGTARHSLALDHALRPLFAHLRAVVVPIGVFAAAEDWGAGGGADRQALGERIDRAAGQLATLVAADARPVRVDPFDAPTPFEQLLSG